MRAGAGREVRRASVRAPHAASDCKIMTIAKMITITETMWIQLYCW